MKRNLTYSRGQVILIILLVTVVGLTIGLSLVSRTIQDVQLSSQISESQKAFSAAESGIEAALTGSDLTSSPVNLTLNGGSANYTVTEIGGSDDPVSIPNIKNGDSYTLWLVDHESDGTVATLPQEAYTSELDVCFGDGINGTTPALELTLLYYDTAASNAFRIAKAAFDPDAVSRDNNFSSVTVDTSENTTCKYKADISNWSTVFGVNPSTGSQVLVSLSIKPVYDGTSLTIIPGSGGSLPSQGKLISSTGKTSSGVARKINVLQGYPALPSIFDYTLYTTL